MPHDFTNIKRLYGIMVMLDYDRRTGYSYVGDFMMVTVCNIGGRIIVVIHKLALFRSATFLSRLQQPSSASIRWLGHTTT